MTGRGSIADRATEGVPRVSIVVPTHFRPDMLSRLLRSLRQLTYPSSRLELIVVGSAHDRGRELVEAFGRSTDFPVTYRVVPDDALRSVSIKRNIGARSARGDILAFVDDDCVPHPDWITTAVQLFETPEVGGVEGAIDVPKPDRPTPTYRGSLRLSLPGGYRTGNMFYRRSVFEECGGFDPSLPYFEDTDLGYTVIERGYRIPFAAAAVVSHPVQPGRPLSLLTVARAVDQVPYLFVKHARSKPELRAYVRVFNGSDYVYLGLYAAALLLALVNPSAGAMALGLGLCILVPLHLARQLWGLHFAASELALTALCQPIVPLLRLFYGLRGFLEVHLGLRKQDRAAKR